MGYRKQGSIPKLKGEQPEKGSIIIINSHAIIQAWFFATKNQSLPDQAKLGKANILTFPNFNLSLLAGKGII